MSARTLFRYFRILLLLAVLFGVAMSTWLTKLRATDWDSPLWVVIYPINGDGSAQSARYITSLEETQFHPIEEFIQDEAQYYKLPLARPFTVKLAPPITSLPPTPPEQRNLLSIMWWSLKLRYWAFTEDTYDGPAAHIRIFVVYYDPTSHKRLAHSLGLEKGMLGVVNAFASRRQSQQNMIIISHEILHTLGATDKYDLNSHLPHYPAGYAKPQRQPLYPQDMAEIMGGRMPLSETEAVIPKTLHQVVIGRETAREINWLKN